MIIQLKNNNEVLKECKVGFSWTMFFAGCVFMGGLVPLFRGSVKWFILYYLIGFLTFGFFMWVMFFKYNETYIKELLNKGYKPANEESAAVLKLKKWIA